MLHSLFYLTIVPFPTVANLGRTEKICQENFAVFPCADPAVNFTRLRKIACIQDAASILQGRQPVVDEFDCFKVPDSRLIPISDRSFKRLNAPCLTAYQQILLSGITDNPLLNFEHLNRRTVH